MKKALAATVILCAQIGAAYAEELLYDPEPPADSAYVRVIRASGDGATSLSVDGDVRVARLEAGSASDYMVLSAGKHILTMKSSDYKNSERSTTLDVLAGRAITVAYTDASQPLFFEDKANANKLKSVLAAYQLSGQKFPVDIRSEDGKVSVFKQLTPDSMHALMVNPIKINLAAFNEAKLLAKMTVDMKPGGTYSLLLFPGKHGAVTAQVIQNKVERYTGKNR